MLGWENRVASVGEKFKLKIILFIKGSGKGILRMKLVEQIYGF